jgi:exopolysaccharide biosynthesis polyprenyl glycosylphosphotransferase
MASVVKQIKIQTITPLTDLRSSKRLIFRKSLLTHYAKALCFVLLDSAALIFARYMAENLSATWNPTWSFKDNPSIIVLIIGINASLLLTNGLYKSGKNRRNYPAIFRSTSMSSLLVLLIAFLSLPKALMARSTFLLFWIFSFLFVGFGRYVANLMIIRCNQAGIFRNPVFLISDRQNSKTAIDLIKNCPYLKFCGWDDVAALSLENIDHTIRRLHILGVSEIYIHASSLQDPMHVYWKLEHAGITLYLIPEELMPTFREVELSYISNIPCFKIHVSAIAGLDFWLKRVIDFLGAIIFLAVLSPIYLLLSLIIVVDNPGPIFYCQTRVGLHGKLFKVWKFRTMITNADQLQQGLEAQNESQDGILFKIKSDPRITRVGRSIRRYSLDELPQIFNVLFGEMSFIGPRPLPLRDVEKFAEHHHIRHEILPGITGLWQISGRSDIQNFDDVVRLDIEYIEQWSIWMDLKIFLKTIVVVLSKSGAY